MKKENRISEKRNLEVLGKFFKSVISSRKEKPPTLASVNSNMMVICDSEHIVSGK